MSPEAWIGLVTLVIGVAVAVIGSVVGAAWWMSSLYSEVKSIGVKLGEIHQTLMRDIADVRTRQDQHHLAIGELRGRVHALEQNADTEMSE